MKLSLRNSLPWMAIAIVALLVFAAPDLMAQDDGGTTEAAEPEQQTLWDLIAAGGWAMYPLGLFSICMITLAVYNFMQLTRKKFVPPILAQSVQTHMEEVRVRSAIEEAAENAEKMKA